ncbi:MAG TPA: T9SS type A sorting domain-containing protein, partial [Chitinophagaceae bacterium]
APSVALRTSTGNNLANFYVADDGNLGTQHLKFGLSKTGGSGNGTYASTSVSYGTTYLMLIRYDIVPGTSNDKLYMWIDPSLAVEPTTASANLSITSGSDGSAGTINSLQLLQDDFFDGTTANWDAFKVSYATAYTGTPTNDVVAWSDLSPAGAPLPVKFGELKGIHLTNGIELDWSSYAELETDHYDIERSADGQSFDKIGQVAAQGNSERKLDYSYTDRAPLAAANYYRIKCVDIDGGVTYSSVIKLSIAETSRQTLNLYPNPLKGSNLTMQLANFEPGNYTIRIFDRIGQQVSQLEMIMNTSGVTQSLVLPPGIKPGTYNLVISGVTTRATRSFIVQ